MLGKKQPSKFYFFGIKWFFTEEPLWYRLVVIILILATVVPIALILHQCAVPTFAGWQISSKASSFIEMVFGRSPQTCSKFTTYRLAMAGIFTMLCVDTSCKACCSKI